MAAQQQTEGEAMASTSAPVQEHDVMLRLEFPPGCSREQIEEYAVLVQEAVDESASGIALGAVIGAVFQPPAIEIGFVVEARSQAEIHHRVALVVGAIEPALPFSFGTESATKALPQPEQRVAVPA